MKRMLFAFCDKYKPLIDCSDNMKDLSASMQNELFSIVKKAVDFDMRHVSDVIQEVCDEVESAMITDISKEQLLSGFATIDNFIRMQRGNVIVIAARPSQGKSALALNIVKNMAGNNKISAFFGLEMSDTENVKRLLASYGDVKLNKLTKMETLFGDNYTAGKLVKNAEQASKLNMYIDSSPRLTVVDIRSKLSTLQSMAGHIDCVVLDYLQLMTPIDGESSEKKIANMSREIKILAGEFNCVFIVLSQLNRQCEARDDKKPILSDLRDSGAIEQDADAVLMLMRPSFYNRNTVNIESNEISVDNNHVWIGIRKNRAGKTGETLLRFDGEFARFRDDSNYGEEIRKAEALLEY
jgi:replicative DNA helicase